MADDELTKALLLEEVCDRRAIADALFASVTGDVPLVQALAESKAVSAGVLARYLERRDAPMIKHVVPAAPLVDRLPQGLCRRLLAIPVGLDPMTGVVDVAVADPTDPHPPSEISFHLGMPVRVVRATVSSLEEAVRRLRMRPGDHSEAGSRRRRTLPPPEPQLKRPRRGGLVIEEDDSVPPPPPKARRIDTPPWGAAAFQPEPSSNVPRREGEGSDIPIPLTRKTFHPRMGSVPLVPAVPSSPGLGEGYAVDTAGFRDVVERRAEPSSEVPTTIPEGSFIPGPPPLPGAWTKRAREQELGERQPFPEMRGVLQALRNAGSRDEILELLLTGARIIAARVALFVVKKGGYVGWVGSPDFADRTALQSVLIPLDANSVFDRAIREDLFVGNVRADHVHAPLLRAMRRADAELAAVPVRVSGKTAVIIVAANLESPTIGTRRLEELARAGGEAFARIVRTRR